MWSASRVLMDRIIDILCICFAIMGKCSHICISPVVDICLNGPPVGASGFKSQRSIVEGPPPIHNNIADLFFFLSSSALALNKFTNGREENPAKKLRLFIILIPLMALCDLEDTEAFLCYPIGLLTLCQCLDLCTSLHKFLGCVQVLSLELHQVYL